MRFTVDTKPLIEAFTVGVVDRTVSKFESRSSMTQLTAYEDALRINLEMGTAKTEIKISGKGEFTKEELDSFTTSDDEQVVRLVDTLVLKKLVSTFDTDETIIDFVEGGLILHSGASEFQIPEIIEDSGLGLTRPDIPFAEDKEITFDKDGWRFIKNHQTYALAQTITSKPVYTYLYFSEDGDVITGNMDNSLFTHTEAVDLHRTCLLPLSTVLMIDMIPEGAEFVQHGDDYIISYDGDGISLTTQFTPRYEDEIDVGSYNANIFLDMMQIPKIGYGSFETEALNKFFTQISLLSDMTKDKLTISVKNNNMKVYTNKNNQSEFDLGGDCPDFEIMFMLSDIKNVIANYTKDRLCIAPIENEAGEIAGILIWSDEMTTLLGGTED